MAKSKNYLKNVREQYEDLPYPPRNPQDEKKGMFIADVDFLPLVNQRCYQGKKDFTKGINVLVAGGGTGDSTIYLAEQLRDTPSTIIHLDMSKASVSIAKERAKVRKLKNIQFVLGSLLDVEDMNIGPFDYINCSGVLHHLENPDAGLKALKSVLKPDGCMGIMVYALYGRTSVYQIQHLMRIVNEDVTDRQEKIDNLKKTLTSLAPAHWHNFWNKTMNTVDGSGKYGDNGLFDLFLHEQDRAYSIDEIYNWAEQNDLFIPSPPGLCAKSRFYMPETYIKDKELLEQIQKMPLPKQYAIGEILNGHIIKHTFYLTNTENTDATLNDGTLVPTWVDDKGLGYEGLPSHSDPNHITFRNNSINFPVPKTKENIALLEKIDNKTPLSDFADLTKNEFAKTLLTNFMSMGALYLRAPKVPLHINDKNLQNRFIKNILKKK